MVVMLPKVPIEIWGLAKDSHPSEVVGRESFCEVVAVELQMHSLILERYPSFGGKDESHATAHAGECYRLGNAAVTHISCTL